MGFTTATEYHQRRYVTHAPSTTAPLCCWWFVGDCWCVCCCSVNLSVNMISCSTPNHSTEPTSSSCRQDLVSSTSSCKVHSLHLSHTEILLVVLTQPWTLTASRICIYGSNTQTFTCALSDICRWYRNRKYYGAIRRVPYRQITAVLHSRRHLSGERLFIQVDARCSACRPCDDITNRHFSITALVTQIFSSFPRFSLPLLGSFRTHPIPTYLLSC